MQSDRPLRIVEPSPPWSSYRLGEIWLHRDLLYLLAARDITVRYRQTLIGVAWAILQPLLLMSIFTVLFGHLAAFQAETGDIPYAAFVLSGLVPWTFFAGAVTAISQSVSSNVSLVTKTAFPRFLIPLSAIAVALVDFAVSFLCLVVVLAILEIPPNWRLVFFLPLATTAAAGALGVGAISAALTVRYRDVRYLVPFALQIGLYTSPIIYPPSLVPSGWAWLMALNPFTGLVGAFRWSLLGQTPDWLQVGVSLACCFVSLVAGVTYFRRTERTFADVI